MPHGFQELSHNNSAGWVGHFPLNVTRYTVSKGQERLALNKRYFIWNFLGHLLNTNHDSATKEKFAIVWKQIDECIERLSGKPLRWKGFHMNDLLLNAEAEMSKNLKGIVEVLIPFESPVRERKTPRSKNLQKIEISTKLEKTATFFQEVIEIKLVQTIKYPNGCYKVDSYSAHLLSANFFEMSHKRSNGDSSLERKTNSAASSRERRHSKFEEQRAGVAADLKGGSGKKRSVNIGILSGSVSAPDKINRKDTAVVAALWEAIMLDLDVYHNGNTRKGFYELVGGTTSSANFITQTMDSKMIEGEKYFVVGRFLQNIEEHSQAVGATLSLRMRTKEISRKIYRQCKEKSRRPCNRRRSRMKLTAAERKTPLLSNKIKVLVYKSYNWISTNVHYFSRKIFRHDGLRMLGLRTRRNQHSWNNRHIGWCSQQMKFLIKNLKQNLSTEMKYLFKFLNIVETGKENYELKLLKMKWQYKTELRNKIKKSGAIENKLNNLFIYIRVNKRKERWFFCVVSHLVSLIDTFRRSIRLEVSVLNCSSNERNDHARNMFVRHLTKHKRRLGYSEKENG